MFFLLFVFAFGRMLEVAPPSQALVEGAQVEASCAESAKFVSATW
jgi:hypothetical protein